MWQRFSLVSHLKIKFAIMIQVFTFQKAKCKKRKRRDSIHCVVEGPAIHVHDLIILISKSLLSV